MTFLIKYFSYPDIHNRPILENGCVPFPIIIFTSETDIESHLKFGSRKRYDEQCNRFKDIKSDILELQQLIDLIHHERKAYDQEGYICCEP